MCMLTLKIVGEAENVLYPLPLPELKMVLTNEYYATDKVVSAYEKLGQRD